MNDNGQPTPCVFCKILAGNIPSAKVYEDEHIEAFLDINPVHAGHTLVVPRAHHRNLYETPDETLAAMIRATKTIALAVKKAMGADGTNVHINNDPAAGQIISHVHFHIIPRFANDGITMWRQHSYPEGAAEAVQKNIRDVLESG